MSKTRRDTPGLPVDERLAARGLALTDEGRAELAGLETTLASTDAVNTNLAPKLAQAIAAAPDVSCLLKLQEALGAGCFARSTHASLVDSWQARARALGVPRQQRRRVAAWNESRVRKTAATSAMHDVFLILRAAFKVGENGDV